MGMSGENEVLQDDIASPHQRVTEREARNAPPETSATTRQDQHLQTILHHLPDAIMVVCQNIVQYVNPAAERLFGRTAKTMIGKRSTFSFSTQDQEEMTIPHINEETTIAQPRVTTIAWDGEEALLISLRDVTQHRQEEQELRQYAEERSILLQQAVERLMVELSRRYKIEKTIQRHHAMLEAIRHSTEIFMQQTDLDTHIQALLDNVGSAMSVNRVTIFENLRRETGELLAYQRYEWVAEHFEHRTDNLDEQGLCYETDGFERWKSLLSHRDAVQGLVRTFPAHERATLEAQAIISTLAVPIFADQEWIGFIGVDECQFERIWTDEEIEVMKIAAGIIGEAIQHERLRASLREHDD